MLAVTVNSLDDRDPLNGLRVGERPIPQAPEGWTTVHLKAAALNHHDVWTLRGAGITEAQLPLILGCDGAGIDSQGNEVIVHSVIADPDWRADETLDPRHTLLSEKHDGTLAEQVVVPTANLVPKPASMSWEEAACLPTSWLTAYRMLFTKAESKPGDTILVQGAGGGVATALIQLATHAGLRVWVTSRDEDKRERASRLGAHAVFATGQRLPAKVDAVMETVGEATWSHSVKSLKPGGVLVVSGATSGGAPPIELMRTFLLQHRIVGTTMGTRDELSKLVSFCQASGIHPLIDRIYPIADAAKAFDQLVSGDVFGKIVLSI
ncbi:Zn-dependent oxidoreductase [Rhodococcus sp. SC4]|nr:Zn-dependent oxidoreductase [Rhodococcus sp. SC4]